MYDIKALYEAESVEDAVRLLQEHPEAQIIAGGSDVLVQIREGKRAGKELVSIYGIDAMRGVTLDEEGAIRIGSLTSFSHIAASPIIREFIPVLGEAVSLVGGPQIRNIGTIGGNTCNGVTSADSASTLVAWDAVVELTGPEGVRRVPLPEFYIKAGKVDLRPGEIQTAILIPKAAYEGYTGNYIKYAMREAMDIATLGCSVNVSLSDDKKTIRDVRIAYGVAGPVPMRAPTAEARAKGREVSAETIKAFAEAVLEDIHPRDSWRAAKAFREHIAVEMAKRALTKSIELARASGKPQSKETEKAQTSAALLNQSEGLCVDSTQRPEVSPRPEALHAPVSSPKPEVAQPERAQAPVAPALQRGDRKASRYKLIHCTINGKPREAMIDVRASLTDLLRNDFRLTSVKKGCEVGECGACNVLVDGECFNSCIYLAVWADGRDILTLEGLEGPNGELSDIQQAFIDEAAVQCGFCTPGAIMSAVEILNEGRELSDEEIRIRMSGHLCRCTGYENIMRAVKKTMLKRLGKE